MYEHISMTTFVRIKQQPTLAHGLIKKFYLGHDSLSLSLSDAADILESCLWEEEKLWESETPDDEDDDN